MEGGVGDVVKAPGPDARGARCSIAEHVGGIASRFFGRSSVGAEMEKGIRGHGKSVGGRKESMCKRGSAKKHIAHPLRAAVTHCGIILLLKTVP